MRQQKEQIPKRKTQKTIGLFAFMKGVKKTSSVFQKYSQRRIKYFKYKIYTNRHWSFSHGGIRENNYTISPEQLPSILSLLKMLCWRDPTLPLTSYKDWIKLLYDINISLSWISDAFTRRLGFSRKKIILFL